MAHLPAVTREEDTFVDVEGEEEDQGHTEAGHWRVTPGGGGQYGGHRQPQKHIGRVLGDEDVAAEARRRAVIRCGSGSTRCSARSRCSS